MTEGKRKSEPMPPLATNWTARLFVIGAFWWTATAFVAVFMDGPLAEYGLRLALGLLHLLCAKACESSGQQQDP